MLDINNEEPADVEEVLEVVKAAKLITKVVATAGVDVNDASVQDTPYTVAEATKVSVPRKRKCFIIQDPEETRTTVTVQPKVQAKDKGKAILIEEPKPLKRQAQIKLDEEVARQLKAELNADINWNDVNEEVKVLDKEVSQAKEVKIESSKREGGSLEQEVAKKKKIEQETEELKKHLQIVPDDDDDDVYTDATPLASKIPITEPKNYSDDFLLNTLNIMFEKPNVEANVWKDQKGKYGLAKIFLLVERMYLLTRFTLEQMINDVRLEVDDESEMSLELLKLVKRQLNEGRIVENNWSSQVSTARCCLKLLLVKKKQEDSTK
nr:hypothetical protein [Tanacetum cinerariifolium]